MRMRTTGHWLSQPQKTPEVSLKQKLVFQCNICTTRLYNGGTRCFKNFIWHIAVRFIRFFHGEKKKDSQRETESGMEYTYKDEIKTNHIHM